LHDCIISLGWENWAHKISKNPANVPVLSQKSGQSCICVLGVSILKDFSIEFWNGSDSVVFFLLFILLWYILCGDMVLNTTFNGENHRPAACH
jgi:hypothetical protein